MQMTCTLVGHLLSTNCGTLRLVPLHLLIRVSQYEIGLLVYAQKFSNEYATVLYNYLQHHCSSSRARFGGKHSSGGVLLTFLHHTRPSSVYAGAF